MKKRLVYIIVGLLVLVIIAVVYLMQSSNSPSGSGNRSNNSGDDGNSQNNGSGDSSASNQAQAEAIRQAEQYKSDGVCTHALTPAVHTATGAKYTFSSGCLAPGWEAEQQ